MMLRAYYVALLHEPMLNKNGQEVTTAVTNLDIHDIARSCKTYGVSRYFIVHPEPEQEWLVRRIIGHWKKEISLIYHPSRTEALGVTKYCKTFQEAFNEVTSLHGKPPFVVMPDAKTIDGAWSYETLRAHMDAGLDSDGPQGALRPLMIVFGTGWGISTSFYKHVDRVLEPLKGPGDYNHLSVRAAAAIVLDRLFGG